jgi:hypothetical protein
VRGRDELHILVQHLQRLDGRVRGEAQQPADDGFGGAFGSGRAAGDANHARLLHPFGAHLVRFQQQVGRRTVRFGDLAQAVRVAAGRAADHQHQVALLGKRFDGGLAVRGGVADVLFFGHLKVWEASAQHAENLVHLVHAEGGLRGDGEGDALRGLHLLGFFEVVDERDLVGRVPHTALRLHMPAMPNIQDVIALPREAGDFAMHLAHQRAGRVDDIQPAFLRLLTHGRRDPVRAEHHIRARRHIV